MLLLGVMLTAIFILSKWGVTSFVSELGKITSDKKKDEFLVKALCIIAATVAGLILLNELKETITGTAFIG